MKFENAQCRSYGFFRVAFFLFWPTLYFFVIHRTSRGTNHYIPVSKHGLRSLVESVWSDVGCQKRWCRQRFIVINIKGTRFIISRVRYFPRAQWYPKDGELYPFTLQLEEILVQVDICNNVQIFDAKKVLGRKTHRTVQ